MTKPMDDLISRKVAIDEIRTMQTYKLFAGDDILLVDQTEAMTNLMMIPTAEPEIIRCKDCKWWLPPHGCNDTAGLIYTTANAFCSYAERRSDE